MKPLTNFLLVIGVLVVNIILCIAANLLINKAADPTAHLFLSITAVIDGIIVWLLFRLFKIDNLKHKL